jgi:hypothetical protein
MEEYQNYVRSFDATWIPEDNLPRLQLFDLPEVRVIGDAIKACTYTKDIKDGKKQEDVAEFDGDDPYDMVRMMLHVADRFFQSAENQQEKLDLLESIQKRFAETQDMTSYYRNMKRVEAGESPKAVRLFHRGNR